MLFIELSEMQNKQLDFYENHKYLNDCAQSANARKKHVALKRLVN